MLTKIACPRCNSINCEISKIYKTASNGDRSLYECQDCHNIFSETKGTFMENIKKPIGMVIAALNSRSEGVGLNATCRIFNLAKNTLLGWERKFSGLASVLMLYSLTHSFLSQIIEGDELYTKVNENLPAEKCKGWTIVLMERASRFIWALKCGDKDRTLFFHAIRVLKKVIQRTGDITLSDGWRASLRQFII